ncbi:hypothetical protein J2Y55_004582 [Bosea sp. BE125]|uniref:toll/interleukin-1 receptor domain-containing protein n=1 Tax=Bosea sp. BE125 TaxID=2817909 RepID=UPI00285F5DFB|nr:toll/interleukin-1 receptor domain-containing protein [Bosea sp. BE125]MDR6873555.1 hypothetical protein [Bosea sp. BE125]
MQDAKYQLVLLGGLVDRCGDQLVEVVRARLSDVGSDVSASLQVLRAADLTSLSPTAPSVAVYLGNDTTTHRGELRKLKDAAVPVLPIVVSLEGFSSNVPVILSGVNGIAVGDEFDFTETANVILENLSLLRRTRRMFISYLRKDSTAVAHQLRVALDDKGYDPFLDTSSVPKGDDFQPVLWHRLLDSDVMIVLDTPNFLSSRWTAMELAEASAMSVGLLRVVWPNVPTARGAELAEQIQLTNEDFRGARLKVKAERRVVKAAEALRARCIAARHTNLVVEFCEEAEKIGAKTTIQPGRYVLAKMPDGRNIAVVPAVGVPDALRYHEASARFPQKGQLADEAVLIYDHRGMLPAWTSFLDWLDDYLPVRGLRVTDTAAKFGRAAP